MSVISEILSKCRWYLEEARAFDSILKALRIRRKGVWWE
jgi:hypothetical protein